MRTIELDLPEAEFERLNALYPPTAKSSTVGERAVELVKFYFRTLDCDCQFHVPGGGVDLEVTGKELSERIEIKGTADADIAWMKLKVSGKPCYDRLLEDLPLYRVLAVYDRNPRICVLKYSEDFEIVSELRWALRPRRVRTFPDPVA